MEAECFLGFETENPFRKKRVLEGIEVKIAAKQGKIEEEKNIDIQNIHFSRSLTLTALLGNYIIVVKMLWKSK